MSTDSIADEIKFAYWVPNVSGGLVTSDIEQRTDWNYEYNRRLAQTAENNGFDYALSQVRYMAGYGAAYQHESTSISLAIALATERLKVIAAIHPGLWQPGVLAKLVASSDQYTKGRFCVNVVSGWFKDEFTKLGEPWLEHGERYRRSEDFIRYLREIWTSDHAELNGDFYRLHDFDLKPKPYDVPGRPHPEIFMGGNHRLDWVTTYPFPAIPSLWPEARTLDGSHTSRGDVSIGHDVWLGSQCFVLSGVTIGHGAVVAARAVVTRDVPPYAIVAGNPAKVVRYRMSPQRIEALLALRWWEWPEAEIKRRIPLLMSDRVEDLVALQGG